MRLAEALGEALGCVPQVVRRPDEIADVAADLRTFSLFADGKVVAVVESGVFADRATAATLFEEVRQQLPWSGGPDDLSGKARDAATRLLQVLRLFDLDPATLGLRAHPRGAAGGAPRRQGAAAAAREEATAEEVRTEFLPLLQAAVGVGLARTRRKRRLARCRPRTRRPARPPRSGADRKRGCGGAPGARGAHPPEGGRLRRRDHRR